MKLEELKQDLSLREEIATLKNSVNEHLELFLEITQLDKLDFYKYDFEYNNYSFDFTVNRKTDTATLTDSNKYSIVLKSNNVILGKILFDDKIKSSSALKMVISLLNNKLLTIHNLSKAFKSDDSNLNIFIVSNEETKAFSKQIQSDVSTLFNANVIVTNDLKKITHEIETKNSKNIIIYTVSDYENIKKDERLLNSFNDFIIVYGPNEHKISLYCGNLNIQHYISFDEYTKEHIGDLILETKNMLLNKFNSKNNIISISGISGGIGCTTIAMNMANILSKRMPESNVLFIDLSHTKAISNLFLAQNPLPEKTVIDLVNSDEFNIENNLENGLVKIKENFYAINGIQKHIDKEYLDKDIFIEKFLNYLELASKYFSTIIIDTGVFDASNLKTTIYDISNEIELITEMNLPHISKLKTLYSLMKRAGLKEKISFIVNRFDARSSLALNDVISILNITDDDDKMIFNYKISNDYLSLGKYWNQCELVSNMDENSIFVEEITNFLFDKHIIKNLGFKKEKKSIFSFFRK